MAYLRFIHKQTIVELTPEIIRDIREQLIPQIKQMPVIELANTIEAAGLSTKNLVALFKKVKEFGK